MDDAEIRASLERAGAGAEPGVEVLASPGSVGARLRLVPGSFDPMTIAHAALVEALRPAPVLLVYSAASLEKERGPGGDPAPPLLGPERRVASLLAFAAGRPGVGVAVASHGLLADQAEAAARAFPGARISFAVGSDKVLQLLDPRWYEDRDRAMARLLAVADVAYAIRAGDEERVAEALAREPAWRGRFRRLRLAPDVAAVSSRSVRQALRRGEDIRPLVPSEVVPFVAPPR